MTNKKDLILDELLYSVTRAISKFEKRKLQENEREFVNLTFSLNDGSKFCWTGDELVKVVKE